MTMLRLRSVARYGGHGARQPRAPFVGEFVGRHSSALTMSQRYQWVDLHVWRKALRHASASCTQIAAAAIHVWASCQGEFGGRGPGRSASHTPII